MDRTSLTLTVTLTGDSAITLNELAREYERHGGTGGMAKVVALALASHDQRLQRPKDCDIDALAEPLCYQIHWGRVRGLVPVADGALCALIPGHVCQDDCPLILWPSAVTGDPVRDETAWVSYDEDAEVGVPAAHTWLSHRRDQARDWAMAQEYAKKHGLVAQQMRQWATRRDHVLMIISRPGVL